MCSTPVLSDRRSAGEADFPHWNPPRLPMAGKEAISPAPPAGFCSQGPLAG